MYYGMEWPRGQIADARGRRVVKYYVFASMADRDYWVSDRPTEYAGRVGYREAVAAQDPDLRAAMRADETARRHRFYSERRAKIKRKFFHYRELRNADQPYERVR